MNPTKFLLKNNFSSCKQKSIYDEALLSQTMTFNECILVPLILKNQTIECCETVVDIIKIHFHQLFSKRIRNK